MIIMIIKIKVMMIPVVTSKLGTITTNMKKGDEKLEIEEAEIIKTSALFR